MIFDWNGTLIEDVSACVEALNTILARRGMASITLERYREDFGFPVIEFYRRIGFGMEVEDWDALAREFHSLYRELVVNCTLRCGAHGFLSLLRQNGAELSVLSASETSFLESELSRYELREFFEQARGTSDLYAKSKIEAAMQLAREIGSQCASIVMIGDTTHDAEVADTLGWQCLLVEGGHQSSTKLRQTGHPVFRNFSDIAEALRNHSIILDSSPKHDRHV